MEFKDKIRVRCLECREEHFIEMSCIGTDKEQRSLGFEYEHTFRGELKCIHCSEEMIVLITVYEYPKGYINYIDISNESCIVMGDITEDSLNYEKCESNSYDEIFSKLTGDHNF